MRKDIAYKTIDGRGEHESFRDCITKAVKELKPNEGIHVIKDFEPFPMYKMMEAKGFNKYVEKVSEIEYHVYFYPIDRLKPLQMETFLQSDSEKIKKLVSVKVDFLNDKISLQEARKYVNTSFEIVTPQEFAVCEQYLQQYGITDDTLAERMEEILEIFKDVLKSTKLNLPPGHPVKTYQDEADAIKSVLDQMKTLMNKKFIKNQWVEIYEKLAQINIHFSRKQNQLFAALEKKGFDKPSKVMWTLDNQIRDRVKKAETYLREDRDEAFLELQGEVIEMIEDMMIKEVEILFPTALELLTEEDFYEMRKGDDEIGYCLIDEPMPYKGNRLDNEGGSLQNTPSSQSKFLNDLTDVLRKHGVLNSSNSDDVLDVSQGKLTLEQINLIFKHLPIDLSYVDEDEVVKFYSDTKHRVFPRSAGVIGRKVQNCHPRESVDTVEQIISAFRKGEQDQAEFWLEINGKFIYIIYNAVRDEVGNFKGVLEMMQDATHIRSLQGSQRLLSWGTKNSREDNKEDSNKKDEAAKIFESAEKSKSNIKTDSDRYNFNKETLLGDIIKDYPFIKDFLVQLTPKFGKLKNPLLFKTMASMATLEMISQRGGFDIEDLIAKLTAEIESRK